MAAEAPATASANEEEGPAKPDKPVQEEEKAKQRAETENKAEEEGGMAEAKPTPVEINEKITSLVAEGKRYLFSLDYENASVKLGEAAELAAETYGLYAPEGYEAHFYYGRAKYEASRLEGEVIQKTPACVNEEYEDADDENSSEDSVVIEQEMAKIREDVVDAMSAESREDGDKTKEGEVEKKEELVEKPEDGEKKKAAGEKDKEEAAEKQEKEEETEKDGDSCEDEESEDEEGDELSNLQVAWEVFEVAKKICEGQPQEELWLLRLADVHIQLALCEMGNENLSSAEEDLNNAETTLQKIHKSKTTRLQIEIYFHFAKLRSLSNDYGGRADYFTKAKDLINRKLAEFEAKVDQLTVEESVMKEDLKGSLPDVESYIEEAIEIEKSFQKVKAGLKRVVYGIVSALVGPKEANDISRLVEKKRSAEELDPEGKDEGSGEPQGEEGQKRGGRQGGRER